jgi:hypothetical protein
LHRKLQESYKPDIQSHGEWEYQTKWRGHVWSTFWLWFLDVFVVPFGIVIIVLVYRVPRLLRKLREDCKTDYESRARVVIEFLNILVDLPCIALGLVLACTWRLPWLGKRVYKAASGHTWADGSRANHADQMVWNHLLFSLGLTILSTNLN